MGMSSASAVGPRQKFMSLDPTDLIGATAIGIGATLMMDLWNLFLKRAFNIPSLNYCMLGRWIHHMPRGTFRHASISAAPRQPFECATGWIAHYTIGAGFALLFVGVCSGNWLARPTLLPVLPSLVLGIAGARTPHPAEARLKSLVTHAVFGLGLYVCALGMSLVFRLIH